MDLHIFHPKKITERILWTYQKELCHKCISETWPMFGRQLRKSAPVVACRWDHGDVMIVLIIMIIMVMVMVMVMICTDDDYDDIPGELLGKGAGTEQEHRAFG